MSRATDTHPDAESVQAELFRRCSTARRFAIMASLTHAAIFHSKRAIARAHPELGARERDLLFVELHYGAELARELGRFWETRGT